MFYLKQCESREDNVAVFFIVDDCIEKTVMFRLGKVLELRQKLLQLLVRHSVCNECSAFSTAGCCYMLTNNFISS